MSSNKRTYYIAYIMDLEDRDSGVRQGDGSVYSVPAVSESTAMSKLSMCLKSHPEMKPYVSYRGSSSMLTDDGKYLCVGSQMSSFMETDVSVYRGNTRFYNDDKEAAAFYAGVRNSLFSRDSGAVFSFSDMTDSVIKGVTRFSSLSEENSKVVYESAIEKSRNYVERYAVNRGIASSYKDLIRKTQNGLELQLDAGTPEFIKRVFAVDGKMTQFTQVHIPMLNRDTPVVKYPDTDCIMRYTTDEGFTEFEGKSPRRDVPALSIELE